MNRSTLVPNWQDHHSHLDQISQAALAAVDPVHIVHSSLSVEGDRLRVFDTVFPLRSSSKVLVVGAGKAGFGMAQAIEEVLGDRVFAGIVVIPKLMEHASNRIEFIAGGHPIPTEGSIRAGEKIATLLEDTKANDLVIVLISGGGSALLVSPAEGVTLEDKQEVTELLLACGADMHEINSS